MKSASPSRSAREITVRKGETVRPADSSAKAIFMSSMASGIGTMSRILLRVSTSIRFAPPYKHLGSTDSNPGCCTAGSVPHRAWSDSCERDSLDEDHFIPVLYMPVGMKADHPR